MIIKHRDNYLIPRITLEPLNSFDYITTVNQNSFEEFIFDMKLNFRIYSNARSALKALNNSIWKYQEELTANTYTGSNYISSCITDTLNIRNLNGKSTAQIYIKDFGYNDRSVSCNSQLVDDAWSVTKQSISDHFKFRGSYFLTSLPKVFGMPFGGLLITNDFLPESDLNDQDAETILNFLNRDFSKISRIAEQRFDNLELLEDRFESEGISKLFKSEDTDLPGAAVLKAPSEFDEVIFKKELNSFGIRGTSFFHNQAFVLPVHQQLSLNEINFVAECTKIAYNLALKSKQ